MSTTAQPIEPVERLVVADATCMACGCLCDDIDLAVERGRIVEAQRACERGAAWFLADRARNGQPAATIEGRAVTVEEALDRAAEILRQSRAPLLVGLTATSVEAQGAAVALADRIGAIVMPGHAGEAMPSLLASQRVGRVSATLGEVRNRADVVVFWGVDPIVSHPRHWERYSVEARGRFVPLGRAGRTVLVVDARRTATADRADHFLQVPPEGELAALVTLRALANDVAIDADRVQRAAGIELAALRAWFDQMKRARYGAFFFGTGLGRSPTGPARVEAALTLVRDLNAHTRFVALPLGGADNAAGLEAVLTWQAGFPLGVDFRRSTPRFLAAANPGALLAEGAADAALIVGDDPSIAWPEDTRARWSRIPRIRIAPNAPTAASASAPVATVAIASATYGIEAPGTVIRADSVSLPLRPALACGLPTDQELLRARVAGAITCGDHGAMTTLRISGGRVIDPAHGVNDEVRDVWVADGRVIAAPADPSVRAELTIDARGLVVMPGGVDVHCHIAGPKVNAARALRPEDAHDSAGVPRSPLTRSGTGGRVPSTFTTGYRYAGLGYTTAIDAAVPALGARQAHHELRDTPIIDKAFLVLMGNNHYVMDQIKAGNRERLRSYVAWLLNATRAYGVKVVNPGGIETWKQTGANLHAIDDAVPQFGVTPRQILTELAQAVDTLGLPHPVHMHGLNLGMPGNAATTLETMQALEGRRAHFAHIQFHSYGGRVDDSSQMDSQVEVLADYVNTHKNLTVDVGQVLFGETTSLTADSAVGQFLHRLSGRKWVSHDVELETGCGVVPIEYKDTNLVHALQWAIGLEWYLRVADPWQVAMSTDHPNGGSFLAYPQIIALLMDRGRRAEVLKRLPARVRERSRLADLTREYSLSEIAIITRAGPARMLGLPHKGHLGPGADADVTIYAPDIDRERMFSTPRYVIKAGTVILDDGDLRAAPEGKPLHVSPAYAPDLERDLKAWFSRYSSIQFANYAVREEDLVSS